MYLTRARQLPCVGNHTRIGIFDGTYFKFCHIALKFDGLGPYRFGLRP